MMNLCTIEDKTAVVVVASYRSIVRNPVRFKALLTNDASLHEPKMNFLKATFHSTIFDIPMRPVREDQRQRRRFTR